MTSKDLPNKKPTEDKSKVGATSTIIPDKDLPIDTEQGASEQPQPQEQVGGKQVDNSVELSCCGYVLNDDGFCHGCWEHCL